MRLKAGIKRCLNLIRSLQEGSKKHPRVCCTCMAFLHHQIEAIQKLSFRIILGPAYKSYHNACAIFETHTLEQRRLEICKRFVTKNLKSEDHCLFTKTENNPTHLRQRNRPIVVEQKCNTVTFQRSSLPYLSKLANSICKSWYCLICFVNCGPWESVWLAPLIFHDL